MRILFDASALINLTNGRILDTVLTLPGRTWFVGPIVLRECEEQGAIPSQLQQSLHNNLVSVLDESTIAASVFLTFIRVYGLGDGETECLTFGAASDFIICCDDRKARKAIRHELGDDRITGSLGLLKDLVREGLMTINEALESYSRMIAAGAFLPKISDDFFR